jgi:hypothetical protein
MKWNVRVAAFLVMAVFASAGCSALPGLRVLAGQDTGETAENRLVETTELVMANKSGNGDPALNAAADRIETAAGGSVDIVEIMNDLNSRTFQIYALYLPDAGQTQNASVNRQRRVFELIWRGVMDQSIGAETLNVTLLLPGQVETLDKGSSFVGFIVATATIAREDALLYLSNGAPSLNNFVNLVTDGTLVYDQPASQPLYQGVPNHPVFMISQLLDATSGE